MVVRVRFAWGVVVILERKGRAAAAAAAVARTKVLFGHGGARKSIFCTNYVSSTVERTKAESGKHRTDS